MKVIIRILIVLACIVLLYSGFGSTQYAADYSFKNDFPWWAMPSAVLLALLHVAIGVSLIIKFLNTFEQK